MVSQCSQPLLRELLLYLTHPQCKGPHISVFVAHLISRLRLSHLVLSSRCGAGPGMGLVRQGPLRCSQWSARGERRTWLGTQLWTLSC